MKHAWFQRRKVKVNEKVVAFELSFRQLIFFVAKSEYSSYEKRIKDICSKDLGIWLLRECLPGYEFVASARRCKTTRSIRRQQQLCDGPKSSSYQFCPTEKDVEVRT